MIFLGEMEKFDRTACKTYVAMLDAYKSACSSERAARRMADDMLTKAGKTAMFANFEFMDYDEQFPGVESDRQVAYLCQKLERVESKLKEVEDVSTKMSAAEAEETASKLESEKEALQEERICRSLLGFIAAADASLKDTQEEVLADYLSSSRRAKSGLGP